MSWSFIWCWCLRTILNIFQLLAMITKKKRKPNPIGIKNHLFVIQNLSNTVTVTNIHKINVVWNTRGTVTIVLYRRWRVGAKSRSINTAAKKNKETPAVIQADRDWSTFNLQNTAKFSLSSAILCATNNGWHKRPTRRSETARQPKRMNDGEWRSRVFPITNTTMKFPMHVSKEKKGVEDTSYNICNEDFFRAIKVKLIFKEETVFFCIVHGEHWSVLPESRSQLEPDELKPVFLYLVPFHGVSVRIRFFFFIVFLVFWCSYTNQNSFYEWEKTYVDRFNWSNTLQHFPNIQHSTCLKNSGFKTNCHFYTYVIT